MIKINLLNMTLASPVELEEGPDMERQGDPSVKFPRERWSITGTALGHPENTIWEFDVDFEAKGDEIELTFTPVEGEDKPAKFTLSISLATEKGVGRETAELRAGTKKPTMGVFSTHSPHTPIECWAIGAYEVSIAWAERNLAKIGVSALADYGVDENSFKAAILAKHGFVKGKGPYVTYMKQLPPQESGEGEEEVPLPSQDRFKVFVQGLPR